MRVKASYELLGYARGGAAFLSEDGVTFSRLLLSPVGPRPPVSFRVENLINSG